MSNLDELKRFENDLKSSEELRKKLDEACKRIKDEDQVRSDGEMMVRAAKELGYEISLAALEQAKAEAEQLDPDTLEAVAGGIKNPETPCTDDNFLCYASYHAPIEDEKGHSNWCWTGWHCAIATLHTETKDQDVYCWSDYRCHIINENPKLS